MIFLTVTEETTEVFITPSQVWHPAHSYLKEPFLLRYTLRSGMEAYEPIQQQLIVLQLLKRTEVQFLATTLEDS